MSELTDKLRREGLRPSIVSKIDWLMDDLETEVADVIREALMDEGYETGFDDGLSDGLDGED
jgi:hypothetical protein